MDFIKELQIRGVELIPDGERLRVRGQLTDADREQIRQHKPEIMAALSKAGQPGACAVCMASGFWDMEPYTGKLLCFHSPYFLGKSQKKYSPCDQARPNCPLKVKTVMGRVGDNGSVAD